MFSQPAACWGETSVSSWSADVRKTKTNFLSHLAGEPGLVKGPVRRNERGVAQERHRQLGCYGDLKIQSRRKECYEILRINELPSLWFRYQLREPSGGGSGGVVVSHQQHLLKVLVSGRAGLSGPGQVLALETAQKNRISQEGSGRGGGRGRRCSYQLQQEVAEVGPRPVRVRSVRARKVNHIQEETLVDVKILKAKRITAAFSLAMSVATLFCFNGFSVHTGVHVQHLRVRWRSVLDVQLQGLQRLLLLDEV